MDPEIVYHVVKKTICSLSMEFQAWKVNLHLLELMKGEPPTYKEALMVYSEAKGVDPRLAEICLIINGLRYADEDSPCELGEAEKDDIMLITKLYLLKTCNEMGMGVSVKDVMEYLSTNGEQVLEYFWRNLRSKSLTKV